MSRRQALENFYMVKEAGLPGSSLLVGKSNRQFAKRLQARNAMRNQQMYAQMKAARQAGQTPDPRALMRTTGRTPMPAPTRSPDSLL
ncbi:MAG: hypothetical protein VXZ72_05160 [Chlamydiota bacterium]|nr:hypothetical protein [Chlamydiota bacterium]